MRNFAAVMLFALAFPSEAVGADFVGFWFSCVPEWQVRDPFALMEISREGTGYRWSSEWGVAYSAGGKGSLRGEKLVLRGCKSYRGEVEQGCDESDPPVHVVLDKSILAPRKSSLKESLRHSKWVRTDSKSWQRLAWDCERLQEHITEKKSRE